MVQYRYGSRYGRGGGGGETLLASMQRRQKERQRRIEEAAAQRAAEAALQAQPLPVAGPTGGPMGEVLPEGTGSPGFFGGLKKAIGTIATRAAGYVEGANVLSRASNLVGGPDIPELTPEQKKLIWMQGPLGPVIAAVKHGDEGLRRVGQPLASKLLIEPAAGKSGLVDFLKGMTYEGLSAEGEAIRRAREASTYNSGMLIDFATDPDRLNRAIKENTAFPKGAMGLIELAFDPLLYIGLPGSGSAPKALSAGYKAAAETVGPRGAKESSKRLKDFTRRWGDSENVPSPPPTVDYLAKQGQNPGWMDTFGAWLHDVRVGSLHPFSRVTARVLPSSNMRDPVVYHETVRGRFLEWADGHWAILSAKLDNLQADAFGRLGPTERTAMAQLKSADEFAAMNLNERATLIKAPQNPTPAEFLEFYNAYSPTPAQISLRNMVQDMRGYLNDMEGLVGVPKKQRILQEGLEYIPHVIKMIRGIKTGVASGKIGARSRYEQARIYENFTEGVLKGETYEGNIKAIMEGYYEASMRKVADHRFATGMDASLKALYGAYPKRIPGIHPKIYANRAASESEEKAATKWVEIIRRAEKRQPIPLHLVNAVEKVFPATGLRQAVLAYQGRAANPERVGLLKELLRVNEAARYRTGIPEKEASRLALKSKQIARELKDLQERDPSLFDVAYHGQPEAGMRVVRQTRGRDRLLSMGDEAFSRLDNAKTFKQNAKVAFSKARASARRPRLKEDEGFISHPAFAGRIYPKEIADKIEKFYTQDTSKFMKTLQSVSSTSVSLGTTLDIGPGFIQLTNMLLGNWKNPTLWGKAQLTMLKALNNPEAYKRILGDPKMAKKYKDAVDATVQVGMPNEFVQEAAKGGTISNLFRGIGMFSEARLPAHYTHAGAIKRGAYAVSEKLAPGLRAPTGIGERYVPKKVPFFGGARAGTETWGSLMGLPPRLVAATFERFGQAFTISGNHARVLWFDSLKDMAERKGGQFGRQEAADFVNKGTGVLSARNLGLSEVQAGQETMLLFAPRFLRSTLGLLADTLQGGVRGDLARQNLTQFAVAGTAIYIGLGAALGQKPKLDPRPVSEGGDGGKFMTYRIHGQNIGVGGPYLALLRTLAHAQAGLEEDPKGTKFISLQSSDQPFLRFLRGRISPIGGAAWDTAMGRNYIGKKTHLFDDPWEWTQQVLLSRSVPFWSEGVLFDDEAPSVGGMTAQFFGLRSYPVSHWQEMGDLRNTKAQERFGVDYDEILDEFTRDKIDQSPDIQQLRALAEEMSRDTTHGFRELMAQMRDETHRLSERRTEELGKIENEFLDAPFLDQNLETLRRKVATVLRDYREGYASSIQDNEKYEEVRTYYDNLVPDRKRALGDVAYDEYVSWVLGDENLEDEYGNYYFDRKRELDEDFRLKWGDDVFGYVKKRLTLTSEQFPDIVRALLEGRDSDEFRGYWEADKMVIERLGPDAGINLATYRDYRTAGDLQQEMLEASNPMYKKVNRLVTRARQIMREKNQKLDAFLYRFGYTSTVRHEDNQGENRKVSILNFG